MLNPASSFAAGQVIQTIKDLKNVLQPALDRNQALGQTSLIDVSSAARVEPLTIVSADCVHLEYMPDVMQTMQSLFTGYYLQAIALATNVGDVNVLKTLEKFSTNRDTPYIGMVLESYKQEKYNTKFNYDWRLSKESYQWRLPNSKNTVAMEAEQLSINARDSESTTKLVNELANLSVGKMISVEICVDEKNKVKVPVSIRLMVNQASDNVITNILCPSKEDTSVKERYHAWRAGRISFFRDLIFAVDLIEEHRKNLVSDKEGLYSKIINNAGKHKTAGLISGNVSLASASNIFVISTAVAAKLEFKLGGKLTNSKIRDKMFSSGYGMLLAVVDPQWERVTIYHRGINNYTQLSIRDIKVSNKGNGPSVTDIMKAYTMGSNPSL